MFPTIESARTRVKEKAGIAADNAASDTEINDLLEASKAKLSGAHEYRPYIVAAYMLWTNKGEQILVEAVGDAKFRKADEKVNNQPTIQGLLDMQQQLDLELTDLPNGWRPQTLLDRLCGCIDEGEAVRTESHVFGVTVV